MGLKFKNNEKYPRNSYKPVLRLELSRSAIVETVNDQPPDAAAQSATRERPSGSPIMYQSWGKLLFIHWQIPVEALRPLIPARLTIDTYDGKAWVAIAPFTIWGLRPRFVPSLPWISHFHEINVRTYVHLNGIPGVWFFSLDVNRLPAVLGARNFFHLPYHHAGISLDQQDKTIVYTSRRKGGSKPADFDATWTIGADLPQAEPGSLDFFLVERYCLYASTNGKLYRSRIFHEPWPLQKAGLSRCYSSMLEANGIRTPLGEPILHSGGPVHVAVWPLQEV
jgi:uncharacterized protein